MTCAAPSLPSSLLSAGAPWPGAADWRPAGWRSGLAPAEIGDALADLTSSAPGRYEQWRARGLDLPIVKADAALLRDCWSTCGWVWRLAEEVIGPPAVDPFWNPWAETHEIWTGVRLLDGRDGRDGFDPRLWGRGTAYVNGPHSANGRTVAATIAHVRAGNRAAVVAPLDGCEWVQGATAPPAEQGGAPVVADLASADLLILLGRLRFRPPPGVAESSPRAAYWLALFGVDPAIVSDLAGRRVRIPEAGREAVVLRGAGDAGRPVAQEQAEESAPRQGRRKRREKTPTRVE
jgi:hypothetical protein